MDYPTPDDPARAPVWDNYIVAQAAQASLGLLPETTLAAGVRVNTSRIQLFFQFSSISDKTRTDVDDIADELQTLVGDSVEVTVEHEVREHRALGPHDGVRWFFAARTG